MKDHTFTTVIGHGWTGSSLVNELIKKNKEYTLVKSEFCLLWEPGGITDLYQGLTKNWDVLVHDFHIRRFLNTCETIKRSGGVITKWYNNELREQINIDLVEWSVSLISELTDFTYKNNRFLLDYDAPNIIRKIRRFERSIERRLGLNPAATRNYYFCGKAENEIKKIIINYLGRLFVEIPNLKKNILLDQALIFNSLDTAAELLSGPKIIVVDRDPRDVLVGMIKRNMLFGSKFGSTRIEYKNYQKWSKRLRIKTHANNLNIYNTTFELLVNDHKNQVLKLSEFLGVKISEMEDTALSVARSNIGVWKNFLNYEGCEDLLEEMGKHYYG